MAELLTVQPTLAGTANILTEPPPSMTDLAAALPAASMASHLHVLLPITLATAAFSAVFQLVLTALVVRQRLRSGVHLLDGGDALLTRRIRAHANFTETVPLALLLMLVLELAGWNSSWLAGCAGLLVVGRLLHAVGVLNPKARISRGVGMAFTLNSLFVMAMGGVWMLLGW